MSEANGILLRRHLRFGWWSLAFFLLVGTTLEAMHGFKVGYYLDASNATRRLLWTLAHAHGSLLGLVHLGFAASLGLGVALSERSSRWASSCLMVSSATQTTISRPTLESVRALLSGMKFVARNGTTATNPRKSAPAHVMRNSTRLM